MLTFPALILLALASSAVGQGPTPMMPFSLWRCIFTSQGSTEGRRVGIPIPRLIFIPSRTSFAALLTIFSLTWSLPDPETFPSLKMTFPFRRSLSLMSRLISEWSLTVNFYISFSEKGEAGSSLQMRSTYTAGTWMHSGSNSPSSTIYSTSAITHFAAVAISALKFRSVFQNWRFPMRSARLALTKAKSPNMDCSITYFLPLKTAVGLGAEAIQATCLPFSSRTNFPYASVLYLMGNPPVSMMVSTPVAVKKAGIPAPPDLIFSARVPWGQIQSSSYPLKNCLSNSQFSPTQLDIMRFICLFLSSTARPQSALPSLSPTPQLLDAMVSCRVPACLTALMRFMGTPQMPNPPTNKKDPSLTPSMASCGLLQTRAKACQRRNNKEESIYPINLFYYHRQKNHQYQSRPCFIVEPTLTGRMDPGIKNKRCCEGRKQLLVRPPLFKKIVQKCLDRKIIQNPYRSLSQSHPRRSLEVGGKRSVLYIFKSNKASVVRHDLQHGLRCNITIDKSLLPRWTAFQIGCRYFPNQIKILLVEFVIFFGDCATLQMQRFNKFYGYNESTFIERDFFKLGSQIGEFL